MKTTKKSTNVVLALVVIPLILVSSSIPLSNAVAVATPSDASSSSSSSTSTPIKYLVVIFQENTPFDHYFATYPNATNSSPTQTHFSSLSNTPSVNGITTGTGLSTNNTNLVNPFHLDRTDSVKVALCDPNHDYTSLQKSYNGGLMDKFVQSSGLSSKKDCDPKLVMGYFDGNTVTALWNYAQHFAMSDNFYSSNIDPSLPGHLNLISGQTHGAMPLNVQSNVANGTVIGDPDSVYDGCSTKAKKIAMVQGKNIGDFMNEKDVRWGWFQGGFKPSEKIPITTNNIGSNSSSNNNIKVICGSAHTNIAGKNVTDYVVHHEPFQYYRTTTNPLHLPPTSVATIGHNNDRANHQYDLSDFWNAIEAGNMPEVSFLKASMYQTGHPGYSDPLDEQAFLVNIINRLQKTPQWNSTAIMIAYDDPGGWYDHVMPPIISQSNDPKYDRLLGDSGLCGHARPGNYEDRCGFGARLPLLIISPYAKVNYVDHSITDQSSILRFIEDNWHLGRIGDQSFDETAGSLLNMFNLTAATNNHYAKSLFLDPLTGLER